MSEVCRAHHVLSTWFFRQPGFHIQQGIHNPCIGDVDVEARQEGLYLSNRGSAGFQNTKFQPSRSIRPC